MHSCAQVKSVYSWYYVTDKGVLSFDQLPWFSVAERLEREKEALLEERAAVQAQMAAQQASAGGGGTRLRRMRGHDACVPASKHLSTGLVMVITHKRGHDGGAKRALALVHATGAHRSHQRAQDFPVIAGSLA